jgi:hypothetical protein
VFALLGRAKARAFQVESLCCGAERRCFGMSRYRATEKRRAAVRPLLNPRFARIVLQG